MKFTFTPGQRIQITGVGDFFRLLSTVGSVTVEYYVQGREIADRIDVEAGYAESFRTINFDRVDITSATAQTVQWETALGSEIRYDRGAATISGTVGLDTATLLALEQTNVRPEASTGSFANNAALTANTPLTIFNPGANVNGAILLSAELTALDAVTPRNTVSQTFIAKNSAPTTILDGEIFLLSKFVSQPSGDAIAAQLNQAQFVAAGLGLYFISSANMISGERNVRACRFKLL